MDAAGHQEVARAFGRGCGQDRRRIFGEAGIFHAATHVADDLGAGDDIGVQRFAAQVQEAIAQADILGIFLLARHRQRQFSRGRQHGDLVGHDFDRAGRHLRVGRFRAARDDGAVDRHDRFRTQAVQDAQRLAVRLGDDLGQAIMVAQIDEENAAMIALAMHPAGQAHIRADIGFTKGAAIVGAIGVHGVSIFQIRFTEMTNCCGPAMGLPCRLSTSPQDAGQPIIRSKTICKFIR